MIPYLSFPLFIFWDRFLLELGQLRWRSLPAWSCFYSHVKCDFVAKSFWLKTHHPALGFSVLQQQHHRVLNFFWPFWPCCKHNFEPPWNPHESTAFLQSVGIAMSIIPNWKHVQASVSVRPWGRGKVYQTPSAILFRFEAPGIVDLKAMLSSKNQTGHSSVENTLSWTDLKQFQSLLLGRFYAMKRLFILTYLPLKDSR